MKIIFWISAFLHFIGDFYLLQAYINVYYKNYNGGPESSSGSIKYVLIVSVLTLVAGLVFYFINWIKLATFILGLPVAFLVLYMLVMIILPFVLGGGRWN